MAHDRLEGPTDDSYNEEAYRRSADASQYHLSENEQVQRQPPSTVSIHDIPVVVLPYNTTRLKAPPASSSQYSGYAAWHAPTSHPGFQEPRYERSAMPCANGSAPGNGAWYETRQNFPPIPPVPAMASPLFFAML